MVPFIEHLRGVEDIELSHMDAEFDQHISDTERLLAALEEAIKGQELHTAKAVAQTEERLAAEKRAAVEVAADAAIFTTERRCAEERLVAVREAVMEAREAAKVAQEEAVQEAIRQTEARCTDLQREAVQSVTATMQRAMGQSEEVVLATQAANKFELAAASAGAALAAASCLLNGEHEEAVLPAEGDADEGLHYF
uniref:Uncharacterized protein n=1 Tax=Haptolina brevifila TaxID=156173 RepID=A0A7S2D7W8_9EUKA